jgi:hypothetical protein
MTSTSKIFKVTYCVALIYQAVIYWTALLKNSYVSMSEYKASQVENFYLLTYGAKMTDATERNYPVQGLGGKGGEITNCLFSSGQQFIMCGGPQNTFNLI